LVTLGGAVAAMALLLAALSAPAWAKPYEHEHFQESTSEIIADFCGLTVRIDEQVSGHFLLNAQGKHKLAYAVENIRGTWSVTNLATNKTYTQVFTVNVRDLKVTDNGDGTLTILVLATGNALRTAVTTGPSRVSPSPAAEHSGPRAGCGRQHHDGDRVGSP
jgi:hypothetical protein